ncbi:MAG: hypothetical protein U1C74_07500 [Phenylobacterium sp.]|nr:hypothetical protein [Phenylobacterium sp.]
MSTLAERLNNAARVGYWTVEVRDQQRSGPVERRYLCHASDEGAASEIAGQLMGSALTSRGYEMAWIDPVIMEAALAADGRRPLAMGDHRAISGEPEWALAQTASAQPPNPMSAPQIPLPQMDYAQTRPMMSAQQHFAPMRGLAAPGRSDR